MYKLMPDDLLTNKPFEVVLRMTDTIFIPFAKDNTDYQQFKKDIANGAELQDPTGTVMTQTQVTAFMQTLP